MQKFCEATRAELHLVWDQCMYGPQQRQEFSPAFSGEYYMYILCIYTCTCTCTLYLPPSPLLPSLHSSPLLLAFPPPLSFTSSPPLVFYPSPLLFSSHLISPYLISSLILAFPPFPFPHLTSSPLVSHLPPSPLSLLLISLLSSFFHLCTHLFSPSILAFFPPTSEWEGRRC